MIAVFLAFALPCAFAATALPLEYYGQITAPGREYQGQLAALMVPTFGGKLVQPSDMFTVTSSGIPSVLNGYTFPFSESLSNSNGLHSFGGNLPTIFGVSGLPDIGGALGQTGLPTIENTGWPTVGSSGGPIIGGTRWPAIGGTGTPVPQISDSLLPPLKLDDNVKLTDVLNDFYKSMEVVAKISQNVAESLKEAAGVFNAFKTLLISFR